jgi:hypothetical protein
MKITQHCMERCQKCFHHSNFSHQLNKMVYHHGEETGWTGLGMAHLVLKLGGPQYSRRTQSLHDRKGSVHTNVQVNLAHQ